MYNGQHNVNTSMDCRQMRERYCNSVIYLFIYFFHFDVRWKSEFWTQRWASNFSSIVRKMNHFADDVLTLFSIQMHTEKAERRPEQSIAAVSRLRMFKDINFGGICRHIVSWTLALFKWKSNGLHTRFLFFFVTHCLCTSATNATQSFWPGGLFTLT